MADVFANLSIQVDFLLVEDQKKSLWFLERSENKGKVGLHMYGAYQLTNYRKCVRAAAVCVAHSRSIAYILYFLGLYSTEIL